MRVVLAAEGTRGDVHPMLGLAERLRARGHDPLLCAPPDFRAESEARGIAFQPVGLAARDVLREHARALLAGTRAALRASQQYLDTSLRLQFEALPELARGADLLIAAGVQVAAASVAELCGVAYRYVVYCPALFPSREHGPGMLPFQSLPPWANRALWRAVLAYFERRIGRPIAAARAGLGLGAQPSAFRALMGPRPLLAADPGLADPPADCPFPVDCVPCLHPADAEPLPAKLEAFLASGPPPVYLGFGSMPDPDPRATTRELLRALGALGCRALVSRGWAGLGGEALPEGVFEVGTVSHAALFPRCALVVHHGGAGTTTSAARAGVPQLLVPHLMDQFYWAGRVQALGVGPPALPRRRLRADPLAERIAAVLDAEWLSERARTLAAELRERLASAADPVEVLTSAA